MVDIWRDECRWVCSETCGTYGVHTVKVGATNKTVGIYRGWAMLCCISDLLELSGLSIQLSMGITSTLVSLLLYRITAWLIRRTMRTLFGLVLQRLWCLMYRGCSCEGLISCYEPGRYSLWWVLRLVCCFKCHTLTYTLSEEFKSGWTQHIGMLDTSISLQTAQEGGRLTS